MSRETLLLEPPCLTEAALTEATSLVCACHPCTLFPYLDADGLWAIGWGSRTMPDGSRVRHDSDSIGPRAADAMLKRALLRIGERVLTVVRTELETCQTAALVALVYDIGATAFHVSPLLQHLCDGNFTAAAAAFGSFVHDADLEISPALVLRRAAQRRFFLDLKEVF